MYVARVYLDHSGKTIITGHMTGPGLGIPTCRSTGQNSRSPLLFTDSSPERHSTYMNLSGLVEGVPLPLYIITCAVCR